MWWVWPHLRRLWGAAGATVVGLTVTYVYSLLSEQALPHLRIAANFLRDDWPWFGVALLALAVASIFAERAHRRQAAPHFIGEARGRKAAKLPPLPASTTAAPTLIVGREDELKQLHDWYARVLQGERR